MTRPAKRALTALIAFCVALLAAELIAARWLPMPVRMFELDPVLIYRTIPDVRSTKRITSAGSRRWITTELNSRGRRGPDLTVPKTAPRVVVFGDSFVLGEDVALEDTFVERLGAELRASGPVEMVNCGVTGYGPDQSCLRFEREAEELAPDLAIFLLYSSNDYGDLVRNKMLRVDDDGSSALHDYTVSSALEQEFERKAAEASGFALVRAIRSALDARAHREERRTRSAPPPYVDWYLKAAPDEYTELVVDGDLAVRQVWQDYYDVDLAIYPNWPSSQYKQRAMRAAISRIREQCARRGVPVFFLVVPSAVDLCPTGEISVNPKRYPTWDSRRLTTVLEDITRELGVAYLNLYEPFRAADPDSLYFGGENLHWTEKGQALAARLAAEALHAQKLWPPAALR